MTPQLRLRVLSTAERDLRGHQWAIVVRSTAGVAGDRAAVLEILDDFAWREVNVEEAP